MALPEDFDIDAFVSRVLTEDLGKGGDVTSNATIPADARFTAQVNARQSIAVAGLGIAAAFFVSSIRQFALSNSRRTGIASSPEPR